jgi:hypothetical protein
LHVFVRHDEVVMQEVRGTAMKIGEGPLDGDVGRALDGLGIKGEDNDILKLQKGLASALCIVEEEDEEDD